MRPARSCAAPANAARYQRQRPEETTLYRVVQEHLDTFLAFVDIESGGAGLPTFVADEFDAYLQCGILAHGFLRLRCNGCAEEKLVAFSRKRRGICPSRGTRRMAEAAAHLVDHVIPRVPVRQWVVSFPPCEACSPSIPDRSPRCCGSSIARFPRSCSNRPARNAIGPPLARSPHPAFWLGRQPQYPSDDHGLHADQYVELTGGDNRCRQRRGQRHADDAAHKANRYRPDQ